ncbi:MAG: hypothetical protein ACI33J_03400 [Clostridium sp.]
MIPKAISRIDKYFVALLQRLGIAVAEEDRIEIQEGKETVIRQPCVADTQLSFIFEKKSAKYQILNNTSEVIFASFGDTCDTGIMIPSECARILVVDDTGAKGSNTVTILPKSNTIGDYDVVEVQQL